MSCFMHHENEFLRLAGFMIFVLEIQPSEVEEYVNILKRGEIISFELNEEIPKPRLLISEQAVASVPDMTPFEALKFIDSVSYQTSEADDESIVDSERIIGILRSTILSKFKIEMSYRHRHEYQEANTW